MSAGKFIYYKYVTLILLIQKNKNHKETALQLTHSSQSIIFILSDDRLMLQYDNMMIYYQMFNYQTLNYSQFNQITHSQIHAFSLTQNYKYQPIMISLKDRIKNYQNLIDKQSTQSYPKPPPQNILKTTQPQPTTVSQQSIKPIPPKPLLKPQVQAPQQPINVPPPKYPPKSAQVISQPKPQILLHQPPKQPNNPNTNPQKNGEKTVQKEETHVMSVKERLRLIQQSKSPIIHQAPIIKSCFIPSKKSPFEEKTQPPKDKEETKPEQKRVSMPQKVETNDGQKRLTFQEMRRIAQGLLNKTQAPPQKPQQNHSAQSNPSQESHSNLQPAHEQDSQKIKVELEQQTQRLQEDVKKQPKGVNEKKSETESDILFKEALKQQPEPTLVTGQSANLNLGVRKTMARKRNNDDFDDL